VSRFVPFFGSRFQIWYGDYFMDTFRSGVIDPIVRKYAAAWKERRVHLMNLLPSTAIAVMCVVAIFVDRHGLREVLRWLIPIAAIMIAAGSIAEKQWGGLLVLLTIIYFNPFWSFSLDASKVTSVYSLAAGVILFTSGVNAFGSFDDALECMPPTMLAMLAIHILAPAIPVVLIAAVIWYALRMLIHFDWTNPGMASLILFGAVAAVMYFAKAVAERWKHVVTPQWVVSYGMAIIVLWMVGTVVADGIVTWRLLNAGGSVSAVVVDTYDDVVETDDGRRSSMVTYARYEFEVKSKKYFGSTKGPQGGYKVGDLVGVQFVADDPTQNREAGDGERLGHFLIVFAIAACIVSGPVVHWKQQVKKRRAAEERGIGQPFD